jgi:hypothetical protein
MTNDLSGLSVGPLTFNDSYTLNGNPLMLMGDLSFANGFSIQVTFTCNVDLKLGSSLRFGPAITSFYNGAVDVNGQTLTIDSYNTTVASLNGGGTVNVNGYGMTVTGNGSFSGTVIGAVEVLGSMPNANMTLTSSSPGGLSGTGTVGVVTTTGSILRPGAHPPCCPGPATGVLHTKSLSIGGTSAFEVELAPGSVSDAIQVTGTVTLNAPLHLSIVSGVPAVGQSFTIIDNDGTDAVIGTFTGMPEGTTFTLGTSQMMITYAGGDGNDVVLRTVSAAKAWTGGMSGNWSDAHNWSPQSIPAAGEALVFPLGAVNTTMTNDLSGLSVGPLTFNDSYTLNGNPLMLMGDLSFANGFSIQVTFTCNVDLKLGSSLRFEPAITSFYNGAVDVNGQTLTIDSYNTTVASLNGGGTVNVTGYGMTITGNGTFSGTIIGAAEVLGSIPNANMTLTSSSPGGLSGTGTVGVVTTTGSILRPGAHPPCCPGSATGVLHTKSLSIGGTSAFEVELAPVSVSDAIQVTGTVTLNAPLHLSLVSGAPSVGQSFTIIDNDGTDAVSGTFTGLPERATVSLGGQVLRISYQGGDGNDVVLAVVADTSAVLTQDTNTTKVGEAWTLTDTVTSAFGTPTGTVSFSADGVGLGIAPLVNGVASLTSSLPSAGPHNVIATFLGTGAFADNVSGSIVHTITRGQTRTDIASNLTSIFYGQTIHFTIAVGVQAPAAGQPTGSVTVLADGVPLGTAAVVNGTATFETAALHPGIKQITAAYSGDTNFDGSTASAIQQNVAKAQTQVEARPHTPLLVGEPAFVTVFVNVTPGSSLVPSGTVSISEGGTVLGTQTLLGGAASFSLSPLALGDHTLVVNYGGNADFDASSATITQSVVLPAISIHGTRVLEGNHGVTIVSLVVSLSAPISQTARVSFSTVAGSATEGEDYEKASGVIEFAPGELTHAIELHIFGDTFPESDETFSVLLSDPVNATIDTPSAVIVIVNDDQIPPRRRPSSH